MYADAPAVAALICMGDENSVRFCDAGKNVFGSEYHIREARCQPQQLPFSQFAQHLSQWTSKCIFLRVRTCLPLPSSLMHTRWNPLMGTSSAVDCKIMTSRLVDNPPARRLAYSGLSKPF